MMTVRMSLWYVWWDVGMAILLRCGRLVADKVGVRLRLVLADHWDGWSRSQSRMQMRIVLERARVYLCESQTSCGRQLE
jgi:hypothetical protein